MYHNPVKVIKTNNWKNDYKKIENYLEIKNPLLVTSKGNKTRNNLTKHFKSIFCDIKPDPNFESCRIAINHILGKHYDGIIAFGGGSVMDTAKVLNAAISNEIFDIDKLIIHEMKFLHNIPSIFIPTTHGTGSEVTMWGTIWDENTKKKFSISHEFLYPNYAILDGTLVKSLPLSISLVTTLDALSHSFEAIWNKNANQASTNKAIKAICSILTNISRLKSDPNNLTVRQNLLLASNNAGLAFSNTMTAAAHSISYPLTIHYNIPHGIASSITLCPLIETNKEHIIDELNIICDNLKTNINGLKNMINDIPQGVLPYSLKEFRVSRNDINKMADESFSNSRIYNNIKDLTLEDVNQILCEKYDF